MYSMWLRTLAIFIFASQAFGQNESISHHHHQTISLPLNYSSSNATEHSHLKHGSAGPTNHNATHITFIEPRKAPTVPTTSTPAATTIHSHSMQASNLSDALRLENVLEVWNLREVAAVWPRASSDISTSCWTAMNQYFIGIQHHKLWATKSEYISIKLKRTKGNVTFIVLWWEIGALFFVFG